MTTNLSDLYKEQISLTEWLEKIGRVDSNDMRLEDNAKRDRLGVLCDHIGLPFDRPTRFAAKDIAADAEAVMEFVHSERDSLWNMRLVPYNPELPKLRTVSVSAEGAVDWLKEQQVNYDDYEAHFVPRAQTSLWGSIFIVNDEGVFGEFVAGGHHQLTQGYYDEGEPVTFYFNFKDFVFHGPATAELKAHIREVVAKLLVADEDVRSRLTAELGAEFAHGYIKGYFETVYSTDRGLWFIDYNRLLHKNFEVPLFITEKLANDVTQEVIVQGMSGSPGIARGKVRIVGFDEVAGTEVTSDEILVCSMTSPNYLPLMATCAGIITDQGGVLSHAAIVCRELGKPCIVGTRKATEVLEDGMEVIVDADTGRVYKV